MLQEVDIVCDDMQCVTPFRKKVNGQFMDFPCGKCWCCLVNRRRDWTTRLLIETKKHKYSYFVTLTYSDFYLPITEDGFETLKKEDVQLFLKRLRKKFKVRYFCNGEYGTHTYRPHYHLIVFSDRKIDSDDFLFAWKLGLVRCDKVVMATLAYVCKYHLFTRHELGDREPPFQLFSRRPGIGYNYLDDEEMVEWHLSDERNRMYTYIDGQKRILPGYLKRKIYTSSVLVSNYEKFAGEQLAKDMRKTDKEREIDIRNKIALIHSKNLQEKLKSKSKI